VTDDAVAGVGVRLGGANRPERKRKPSGD